MIDYLPHSALERKNNFEAQKIIGVVNFEIESIAIVRYDF